MSVRKIALIAALGLGAMFATSLPAVSGDGAKIQVPGTSIDVSNGNTLLKAGEAKIKVKPGKRGDCVKLQAGTAKINTGKVKNGECKS
ncbi:MAG: hypothetical protein AAGA73_12400 [Pseudomonadota bacterium]